MPESRGASLREVLDHVKAEVGSIAPRHQPFMTRASYSRELVNAMTFPVAMAMVEAGVVGILATKTFTVSKPLYATMMAAPMFANLTSILWARLARGRSKIRVICALQCAALLTVVAVAMLPQDRLGQFLLTGLVVLARCLVTGIVTLRSTVWRMNYPRQTRARITGKLALINTGIFTIVPLAGFALLDVNPQAFRFVYPISAVIAAIGVTAFSRIRIRGEREMLRFETTSHTPPRPHGTPGPIYEYDPVQGPANFWTVLRHDHVFRRYMTWQFAAGFSNMMAGTVFIYLIAELTVGKSFEYALSVILTTALPMAFTLLTLPVWAHFLDRVHIVEFRAFQGWFWIICQMGYWLGAAILSMPILALTRVVEGTQRGGGMLAWNLGHNDFADRRMVAIYMGIHVTLTGVRGAIAPFVAMALYGGWDQDVLFWAGLKVPAFPGIKAHVFLITTVIAVIAEIGFLSLKSQLRRASSDAEQG